jgi:hypothetical protein
MEADCRFVIERHHLAPIWASGGAVWMKSMMAANVELTSQRPTLKAVTPEVWPLSNRVLAPETCTSYKCSVWSSAM